LWATPVQVLVPRIILPWSPTTKAKGVCLYQQAQGHLPKTRPHLISMTTERESRLGLRIMIKIYFGSKGKKKTKAQLVVN
jgi:hypothetical protein